MARKCDGGSRRTEGSRKPDYDHAVAVMRAGLDFVRAVGSVERCRQWINALQQLIKALEPHRQERIHQRMERVLQRARDEMGRL
jgi:hypothetical protein